MKLFGFEITRAAEERSLENPAVSLADAAAWEAFFGVNVGSASGETVTIERALGVPAVWGAVNFLSDTIASLPLKVYQRTENGNEVLSGDPLLRLLHDAPNPEETSYDWRKGMLQDTLTIGRSFTFIERAPSGRVLNLWPIDPTIVSVNKRDGRTIYTVKASTFSGVSEATYSAEEIIDLPFMLKSDRVGHYSPIYMLRNAIGLSIALESYASRFFANGGVPPLQLVGPFNSPEGAARASADVARAIKQARGANRNVLPLPAGHELKSIGTDPEKSQMIEARRMQIEEVARVYNLPPSFLHDLTRATFSNHEQAALSLTKHTIGPWLQRIEQELNLKLFDADGKRFVKFSIDGLLRGDFAARMSAHATAITHAIRSPDEVRALEDLPPMGGKAGELHIQGATVPINQPLQVAPAPDVSEAEESDDEE